MVVFTVTAHAQQGGVSQEGDGAQTPQQTAPQTVQAIRDALQRGDVEGAKGIYQGAKKIPAENQGKPLSAQASAMTELPQPSLFEQKIAGNLKQFGYELFSRTASNFNGSAMIAVGPDYIIGPGDEFTLTLWGTTEGIFALKVTKEGEVTLPKVGVVPIAGIRFGELEKTIKRHLSKYYSDFNLSIAMGGLKTVTIYVVGEVVKPGSYALSSLTTAYGALFAAGGPTKQGTLRSIQVLRTGRVIKTIDLYDFLLKGDRSQDVKLQSEDTVFVPLIGTIAGVAGTVYRPAIYELKGHETISELIETAGGIMPIALGGRLQLVRYADNLKKTIVDIKLDGEAPGGKKIHAREFTEPIRNMDSIIISPVYEPVWETVDLAGAVEHPGVYQWRPDLKLREIIMQGQLNPQSDMRRGEVIRLTKDMMDRIVFPVDLTALMAGDESQNIKLEAQDLVRVYSSFKTAEKVLVSGEVVRAGEYEINKGEHLSDLLLRIGGITKEAYPYGTVFKRVDVKNSQEKNLQSFIVRMQSQVLQNAASGSVQALSTEDAAAAKTEMTLNQGLLENLKGMREQNEGRVAINITEQVDEWAGSANDLLLKNGDSIFIPKKPQEVLVMGEVHSPSAQVFIPGLKVKDFINQTGGYTKYAEKGQVYVLQANGTAISGDSPSIGNIENKELKAGDTVFVPQILERNAWTRLFKDVVDIMFKTAVVFATIHLLF